jgi:hypothetical protein
MMAKFCHENEAVTFQWEMIGWYLAIEGKPTEKRDENG